MHLAAVITPNSVLAAPKAVIQQQIQRLAAQHLMVPKSFPIPLLHFPGVLTDIYLDFRVQLTEMTLTTQYHTTAWLTRLDKVPPAWCHLVSLRKLVLRGQTDLTMLPHFLLRLPLHHLDISYNKMLNFELLAHMTRLRTLSMQV